MPCVVLAISWILPESGKPRGRSLRLSRSPPPCRTADQYFHHGSPLQAVALVDESVSICGQAINDNDWHPLPCYDNLSQALGAVRADAVVIMHAAAGRAQAVRLALKMGLHVYVANPLAAALDQAIELVDYAAGQGLSIVVDPPHRYGVTERTLTGWTREARHGALTGAAFTVALPVPAPASPTVWERCAPGLCALLPIVGWGVESVGEAVSGRLASTTPMIPIHESASRRSPSIAP
ncbi:MAG: Gfo/Idh/MocA family oxidoreductase [bacterium]|nr:Gfo/Idh/MocA family oxidoreductase [bacterium]